MASLFVDQSAVQVACQADRACPVGPVEAFLAAQEVPLAFHWVPSCLDLEVEHLDPWDHREVPPWVVVRGDLPFVLEAVLGQAGEEQVAILEVAAVVEVVLVAVEVAAEPEQEPGLEPAQEVEQLLERELAVLALVVLVLELVPELVLVPPASAQPPPVLEPQLAQLQEELRACR